MHRHRHDRCVVDIGIVVVGILEGPAAGPEPGPGIRPVAVDVQHLLVGEPVHRLLDRWILAVDAGLQQGMGDERRIPDGRDAGLAIGLVVAQHEQLFDRFLGDDEVRMIGRVTQRRHRHDRVGHSGIDRAQPVLAVQTLGDE